MAENRRGLTYAQAGVDIDAGNRMVELIKPLVRATARPGADSEIGGFGGIFDLKQAGYRDPVLVAATDGVGTKLKVAIETGRHDTIGIDLVAMSVNDLVVQGAEPLFFLDYYACGKLEPELGAAVVAGISIGCREAGCALIGGETAEMPGVYRGDDYDLAGFAVGAVERDAVLPRTDVAEGDVIIGLASSGVHSNGYSLVRKVVEKSGLNWSAPAPFMTGKSLGESILAPTRIYVKPVLRLVRGIAVKGLAHITGGGLLENVPRIMPARLAARVERAAWNLPPLFQWLKEEGNIADAELYRVFNCGIGMVAVVGAAEAGAALKALRSAGESAWRIGRLSHGSVRTSGGHTPSTNPPRTTRSAVIRRASSGPRMRMRAPGRQSPICSPRLKSRRLAPLIVSAGNAHISA